MRALALVVAAGLVGGCALNVRLLEDGKAHLGNFNPSTGTMEVTIDGDPYKGTVHRGAPPVGFMTGFSGTRTFTGTTMMVSSDFSSLLTNSAGKILRCQFNSALGRGQGLCQMNDGRTFDLVQ